MAQVTKLQDCTWRCIDAVNKLVECDEASFEDRHNAIEHVKKHIEERARQTGGSIALEDLLGDWTR